MKKTVKGRGYVCLQPFTARIVKQLRVRILEGGRKSVVVSRKTDPVDFRLPTEDYRLN